VQVANYIKLSDALESFDLAELDLATLTHGRAEQVAVVLGVVAQVDPLRRRVVLADGRAVAYDRLAVCTGAQPRIIVPDHPRVMGLRDSEVGRRRASARRANVRSRHIRQLPVTL
jgi:NAD(P)H-nitrite reductase large subunit